MTEARAISAQLVDIRNVGTHKVVKLTLHAPEEHALRIMELFGWPTGVNPVPVAIARLETKEVNNDARRLAASPTPPPSTVSRNTAGEAERAKKSPAQIAGYLCSLPAFHKFLRDRQSVYWRAAIESLHETAESDDYSPSMVEIAAETVRIVCDVESRRDIAPDNAEWSALQLAYKLWEREAEIVPA